MVAIKSDITIRDMVWFAVLLISMTIFVAKIDASVTEIKIIATSVEEMARDNRLRITKVEERMLVQQGYDKAMAEVAEREKMP